MHSLAHGAIPQKHNVLPFQAPTYAVCIKQFHLQTQQQITSMCRQPVCLKPTCLSRHC